MEVALGVPTAGDDAGPDAAAIALGDGVGVAVGGYVGVGDGVGVGDTPGLDDGFSLGGAGPVTPYRAIFRPHAGSLRSW